MEFEQSMSMLRDFITAQRKINDSKHKHSYSQNCDSSSRSSPRSSSSQAQDHLDDADVAVARLESFEMPMSDDSSEKKLSWLRSQIIGGDLEFESPFGKRRLTYADHTASGRCLHYIENYIINNVLPFYGNSHSSDSYVGERTTKMVLEASQYVKRCLGGREDDALIFCGWGTTAAIKRLQEVMGIAIPSTMRDRVLKCLQISSSEERWVVFVGPYEHHSNILSWRQSLAEVVEIGLDEDNGQIDMEALRLQLIFYQSTNRPMLGSFSACSNVTGTCTDTRALARLLHQYGAFACFDFAASGPYVEIDMRSGEIDGYDGVFLSPHKFVGGPGSPGILLMSNQLYQLRTSPPSTCGGGTVNYVNGFNDKDTLYVNDIEEREDAGTPPIIGKIRAALAFWVKEYIGYQVIEKQEHDYIERALERLVPNHNICILGNKTAKRQAILSFLIYSTVYSSSASSENVIQTDNINGKEISGSNKGLYMWREIGNKRDKPFHGPFVAKLLNDLFGIQARGGCACAGPYGHILLNVDQPHSLAFRSAIQMGYNGVKPGWTRISFPYYMSNEEFEFILAALEFIAIYGQRFLPLYHFNWKTGVWTFKEMALREILQGKEPNCNFCGSSMAMATRGGGVTMQGLNLGCHESNEHHDGDANDQVGVIGKYASYLATAKSIASLLPKFPPQRKIPEAIDIDLMPFRV
ncbi:putative cysteine desulfurase [Camellia lanceoleosa]|uniref:Cysteine desulfurase n=1 Tax=Camellia lanceoleosa TaxID=1840588 RepID=A0ACC0GBP7_9ERIC|nr:putative cysteine desulfurase [Camellia lanceoleosa]